MIIETQNKDKEFARDRKSSMNKTNPFPNPNPDPNAFPPSYTDSVPSPTGADELPSLPPPCNFLRVQRRNKAIRGRWNIDTSLQIPVELLAPYPANEIRPNLRLETRDGHIDADVHVQGPSHDRARIELDTKDGYIKLGVTCQAHQRLWIKAITKDGWITIFVPRHFTGPLRYSTGDGRIIFSPEMLSRLTFFSDSYKDGKAFLGDVKASGFVKDVGEVGVSLGEWDGDELEARTNDGNIRIFYEGETVQDTLTESLFKQVKGWLGR